MIRVTVWNEYRHEKLEPAIAAVYPRGIHQAIADFLGQEDDITVRTATLDEPECGLTEEVIRDTDVLMWWGHIAHAEVPDEIAERVHQAVLRGMGLIVLHSGHHSKPFRLLTGTPCNLHWREEGDLERVWTVAPAHPIAQGVGEYFNIEHEEMYGEPFDIPQPDELVFIGWYEGGEVFRSGCCFYRGRGKIFYFQPGHETLRSFHNPYVQLILRNAAHWAARDRALDRELHSDFAPALEPKREEEE